MPTASSEQWLLIIFVADKYYQQYNDTQQYNDIQQYNAQDIDVASIEPIQSFLSLYIYYYIIEEEGCQRR